MIDVSHLLKKHGLKESHVYLLELIPLIEMIWADGRAQAEEVKILYRFTIQHLCRLSGESEGQEVISEADVNGFLDYFLKHRPDPALLEELRQLCVERLHKPAGCPERAEQRQEIMNYCLDIAAACVKSYPYRFNERVLQREKQLIVDLFESLRPV